MADRLDALTFPWMTPLKKGWFLTQRRKGATQRRKGATQRRKGATQRRKGATQRRKGAENSNQRLDILKVLACLTEKLSPEP
jgi:hypothetical protein